MRQNQLLKAEELLRALLAEHPNHPQALYSLAQIGIRSGVPEQVLPTLVHCVDRLPKEPGPLLLLAQVSADLAMPDRASTCYQLLLKRFPNWPHGYFSYAGFLQTQGQLAQAKTLLLKVVELDPEHSGAYLALAGASSLIEQESLVAPMTQLLDTLNRNPDSKNLKQIQLHYGLGKAMADRSEYREAFEHWRHANELQLQACQFRVAQMQLFFEKLKEEFSSLQNRPSQVCQSGKLTPIFLVGLPRSGSTLLEQMLSRHTKIETAGEVHYLADVLVRKLEELTKKAYPQDLRKIPQERILQLGESYISKLQSHHPQSNFIIDKLPANFQSIGLIRKAFPHAIIIHLTRHPVAVGLSIFRNYFLANEPYFCDLDEFAQYHKLYRELMEFWQSSSPDNYYEMSYESLVDSPKEQLFRLLDFCGLEWQDECLEFYKATGTVNTLSVNQVRQPLYQTSTDDWKNYSNFLQDFISKVGY